ncbi:MAG: hypothetical protein R6X34_29520 [Chloroflexota bacterium]
MQVFLKLKSWQIFCLLFAAPFIGQFFIDPFSMVANGSNANDIFLIFGGISYITLIVILAWFWSLGTHLNQLVLEQLRPSSILFRIGVVYQALYVIAFILLFFTQINFPSLNWIPLLICPFHLLAMFFAPYSFYFISKNLVMAEKKCRGENRGTNRPVFCTVVFTYWSLVYSTKSQYAF